MPTVGRKGKGNHTQSVLFLKSEWTRSSASTWLRDHDFKTDGFEETQERFRFRQVDPEGNKFRYRNKDIGNGITLVLGFPKGSPTMAKPVMLKGSFAFKAELDIQASEHLDDEDEEENNQKPVTFFLAANTGRIPMDLEGFFHPVIIDLKGIRFQKTKTPVIMDHNTALRIGHTTDQVIAEGF